MRSHPSRSTSISEAPSGAGWVQALPLRVNDNEEAAAGAGFGMEVLVSYRRMPSRLKGQPCCSVGPGPFPLRARRAMVRGRPMASHPQTPRHSAALEWTLGALNGAVGDYLRQRGNGLESPMELFCGD